MDYISTRGEAPALGFEDVLLTGLANDGGLYVPRHWPRFAEGEIAGFAGKPFAHIAADIVQRFVGDEMAREVVGEACRAAFATFRHPAICPLTQMSPDHFLLELFHGPTLAFKDVAMQLLARLMDHALAKRNSRVTIVAATSGDTGGAAIEAFRGRARADVFVLYPEGRVSDVQRRQMTTASEANVHALAIKGNFDDCQAIVKAMFAHPSFRDKVKLSAVNSINWARILAQIVYFVTSAVALGAPARRISFSVPTGNFGDIFAGYVAQRMGLPITQLIIATNQNDILARALASGDFAVSGVTPTTSPSMDIEVSSNFERLLFEAEGRDAFAVRSAFAALKQHGRFSLSTTALASIRTLFAAAKADEPEVAAQIKACHEASGYVLDPHTAVGVVAARKVADPNVVKVVLATAHPAKFPDAVERACGVRPLLPPILAAQAKRPERFISLACDQTTIERYVLDHCRIAGGVAA